MSKGVRVCSHEYFVVFLLLCTWNAATSARFDREHLESRLVHDIVAFHGVRLVNIISQGIDIPGTKEAEVDNRWFQWTLRQLYGQYGLGLSVTVAHRDPGSKNISAKAVNDFHHFVNTPQPPQHLVVQRMLTEEDLYVFKEMYDKTDDQVNWLLLSDTTIESQLSQVSLPINSKVVVALVDVESRGAILLEAYKVAPKLPLRLHVIGTWLLNNISEDDALHRHFLAVKGVIPEELKDLPNQRLLVSRKMKYGVMTYIQGDLIIRRRDLTGLHLRCTIIENPPFIYTTRTHVDGTVALQGGYASLFYLLQKITNFTMVRDKAWGSFINGRWNGVIGEVLEGAADIAVSTIDLTAKRSEVVDFLMTLSATRYYLIFKRPSSSDQKWTAYTQEFQGSAWIMLGIFCLLLVALFLVFVALAPSDSHLELSDGLEIIVGFLLGQGTNINVSATSIRLLMLTSLMFHVLMVTHYTSDLLSGLTAGVPRPLISDLSDISRNPKFTLGFEKNTALDEFLSVSLRKRSSYSIHEIS
ncbi:probable glutamate receptor isoform X2 [Macrobrachium nipponense]|uniref:probable glutamate receptor isoform X2 n=1 Tax=Macrobrachium nipponense TaxID=159736 RepID=UPI0030C7C634